MSDYIERSVIERLLAIAAAGDSEEKRHTWARAMCIAHITPTADVAPVKHGRWISWEEADNCVPSASRHECSICHDAAQVLVNGVELLSVYCPNCGAKMDGGDDDATNHV